MYMRRLKYSEIENNFASYSGLEQRHKKKKNLHIIAARCIVWLEA